VYSTVISSLSASGGKRRIKEFHLDDPNNLHGALLQALLQTLFKTGGVGVTGTLAIAGKTLTVTNKVGVTLDRAFIVGSYSLSGQNVLPSEAIDFGSSSVITDLGNTLGSLASGTKVLLALDPTPVELSHSFVDPESSQTLLHALTLRFGKLKVIQGDLANHPAAPNSMLPIAKLTVTGVGLTLDEEIKDGPIFNQTPSPLIVATLLNSWVISAPTDESPGYYLLSGLVYLQGSCKDGVVGSAIFTLPATYRPAKRLLFSVPGGTLEILANGTVQLLSGGSNSLVSLSGLTFRAA
jgi:hypothetical protein